MDKENLSLFTLREYILIKSTVTNKPFFDESSRCYMFELKSDANAFCNELKDVKMEDAKTYRLPFITDIYDYGGTFIRIKLRNKGFKDIPVEKGDIKKQYTNPETNRNILLLKQTSKKKYARNLKTGKFLAPILIDPRFVKIYPSLHYSYATTDGNTKYYTLFTSLKEFEEWNSDQPQDWKPVEMQLIKIGRIRKKDSVIINPLSDKLVLNNKLITEIIRG